MKIQQGDVILNRIEFTESGPFVKLNSLVLAEGESTGHSHRIVSGIAELIILNDERILRVLSEYALLKHEEHKEINIPRGDYKLTIVREYDHFEEEVMEVVD